MDAFLAGLEQAKENGHDLAAMGSVASFFVSRVDTEVDTRLGDGHALRSKAALANARLAYQHYEQVFAGDRWKALEQAGAKPQRALWASTGVKDPALPDTLYVTELVAPGTVNTMPEKTLQATFDHGEVTGDTVTGSYAEAQQVLDDLEAAGVDYDDVVQVLEDEGLEKFEKAWGQPHRLRHRPAREGRRRRHAGRRHEARRRRARRGLPRGERPVSSPTGQPGPEDVADALRSGVAPTHPRRRRRRRRPARDGGDVARQRAAGAASPSPSRAARCSARATPPWRPCAPTASPGSSPRRTPTLWGPDAAVLAGTRLGWLDAVGTGRELLPRITALADELRAEGVDRVVLAGMGGSSLAPEVVCATYGRPLVTLDSTDPGQVRAALQSSSTARSSSSAASRAARSRPTATGGPPAPPSRPPASTPPRRLVVVTDPGSPLAAAAAARGRARGVPRRPRRRGPLLGADRLRAGALGARRRRRRAPCSTTPRPSCPRCPTTPGPALVLGALLGGGAVAGRDKLVLAPGPGRSGRLRRLGRAAGRRVHRQAGQGACCPSSSRAPDAPGNRAGRRQPPAGPGRRRRRASARAVDGPLGAQFLVWEYATAVAGRVLSIDPFDQPNVQESKDNTGAILGGDSPEVAPPLFTESGVEVSATGDLLAEVDTLAGALEALLPAVPERGYLAVMAYLDRRAEARAGEPAGAAGRPGRAPGHVRLGARASCTPPASSTRAGRRPASSCRSPPPCRTTSRCRASRTRSACCRRRSPPATCGPWPPATVRSCTCTCADRAAGLDALLAAARG